MVQIYKTKTGHMFYLSGQKKHADIAGSGDGGGTRAFDFGFRNFDFGIR